MNNTITQTYFLYCRKSSEDDGRQVLSIDSQIGTLTDLAKSQGIAISRTFKMIMQNKEEIERELLQVRTLQNTENKMLFMQIIQNCPVLRRRKDSNLRSSFPDNILAGCSFKPLRHASTYWLSVDYYGSFLK